MQKLATERLTRATEVAPLDVVGWLELAKVRLCVCNYIYIYTQVYIYVHICRSSRPNDSREQRRSRP